MSLTISIALFFCRFPPCWLASQFGEFSFTRKAPNSVYESASNTKVVVVKKK